MSSRKEEKERLRKERLEREQAASAASNRRKRMGYVVTGVLAAAAAIVAVVLLAGGGGSGGGSGQKPGAGKTYPSGVKVPARKIKDEKAAVAAAGCTLTKPKDEGRGHTNGPDVKVKYKANPPTSGEHAPPPGWASDGVYDDPPSTESIVHSLEHGRVVFQFRKGAPAEVRGALKTIFDEDAAIMILTQNASGMKALVAATAWDVQLVCPAWNDKVPDAFRAFRDEHRLKGPEFVPNPE
jgi:hypothetical protein